MRKFFNNHHEQILPVITVLLLGAIIMYFVWGSKHALKVIDESTSVYIKTGPIQTFNVADAKKIDLRSASIQD